MAMQLESPSELAEFAPEPPPSAHILVAEDPFVGTFLRTVLQKRGYKVITGDATRASDLLRQRTIAADLVITNNPAAFLEFSRTLPMLYIAASPDFRLVAPFFACRVLRKPFRNDELLAAVDQLAGSVIP